MTARRSEFAPRCLSVLFGGRCELACRYCFAAGGAGPVRCAADPAVAAAARLVAREAVRRGRDLVAGLNGGAEPLAAFDSCRRVVGTVRAVGADARVPVRIGLTTAGSGDPATRDWVAAEVDAATVSLDGRREIHDRQRPHRDGGSSWSRAVATLERLAASRRGSLTVRMTVTSRSASTLAADVAWIADRFAPDAIVVEPVYRCPGTGTTEVCAPPPEGLAGAVAAAREEGARRRVPVATPEIRADGRHGRFCPPLRGVLAVTPDGHATACFLALGERDGDRHRWFGGFDRRSGSFVVDGPRLATLVDRLQAPWRQCSGCSLDGACALGCPDACPLEPGTAPDCARLLAQAPPELRVHGFRATGRELRS